MRPTPDHRRRGARRGVPRPAARPQRRAARACARCTPTAPARRWSRCARCRCWPGRTSRPGSWCRPSRPRVDLVVHLGIDHARRTPGQRDRRRCPGRVENDVIETEPIFVRARRRAAPRRRACRRGRSASSGVGIDVHAHAATAAALMGALRRARRRRRAAAGLVGVRRAAPAPRRRRPARSRAASLLARAGLGQRLGRRRSWLLCVVLRRWSALVVDPGGLAHAAGGAGVRR